MLYVGIQVFVVENVVSFILEFEELIQNWLGQSTYRKQAYLRHPLFFHVFLYRLNHGPDLFFKMKWKQLESKIDVGEPWESSLGAFLFDLNRHEYQDSWNSQKQLFEQLHTWENKSKHDNSFSKDKIVQLNPFNEKEFIKTFYDIVPTLPSLFKLKRPYELNDKDWENSMTQILNVGVRRLGELEHSSELIESLLSSWSDYSYDFFHSIEYFCGYLIGLASLTESRIPTTTKEVQQWCLYVQSIWKRCWHPTSWRKRFTTLKNLQSQQALFLKGTPVSWEAQFWADILELSKMNSYQETFVMGSELNPYVFEDMILGFYPLIKLEKWMSVIAGHAALSMRSCYGLKEQDWNSKVGMLPSSRYQIGDYSFCELTTPSGFEVAGIRMCNCLSETRFFYAMGQGRFFLLKDKDMGPVATIEVGLNTASSRTNMLLNQGRYLQKEIPSVQDRFMLMRVAGFNNATPLPEWVEMAEQFVKEANQNNTMNSYWPNFLESHSNYNKWFEESWDELNSFTKSSIVVHFNICPDSLEIFLRFGVKAYRNFYDREKVYQMLKSHLLSFENSQSARL